MRIKFISLCILITAVFSTVLHADEKEFIDFKKKSMYKEALSSLSRAHFPGNTRQAAKMFFLNELSENPELAADCLSILDSMNKEKKLSPYFAKLDEAIRLKIYSDSYDFKKCSGIMTNGYPLFFELSQPLKNFSKGDMEKADSAQIFSKEKGIVRPDYAGSVVPENYLNGDGAFILRTYSECLSETEASFFIGRSGFMMILVDGIEIYKGEDSRNFFSVQDILSVKLSAGMHIIEIRLLPSLEGSMRFSLSADSASLKFQDSPKSITGKLLSFKELIPDYFDKVDQTDIFFLGYVKYSSGFVSSSKSPCSNEFSSLNISDYYYSQAAYYRALSEDNSSKRDYYFRAAHNADKLNYEALVQLGFLKLKNKMFYQCGEIINTLEKKNAYSPSTRLLKGAYFAERGWYDLAEKEAAALKNSGWNYSSDVLYYKSYLSKNRTDKVYFHLKNALLAKRSFSLANILLDTSYYTSRYGEDLKFANSSFPESTAYALRYAEYLLHSKDKLMSGAIIDSVKRTAPWNSYAEFLLGETFSGETDNSKSAGHFIKAYENDSSNNYYKELYHYLVADNEPLDAYLPTRNLQSLKEAALKHEKEAAVVLFDDSVEKIFSSGMIREKRRKAVLINNTDNAQNVMSQSFWIDPSSDSVDRIQAYIISKGNKTEVNNIISQNESDADSRLYYDMESVTVNFTKAESGDIIFLEYSITRRNNHLKGFYSSRKFFDRTDRILFSSVRIVNQTKKPLKWRIYNSAEKCKVLADKNETSYLFSPGELQPLKPEDNSVPYSGRMPSFAVSSFNDWNEFNKWYCDLIGDKTVMTDEMKRKADELTAGVSDEEKIRRIYEYITARIRYVGFELGSGSIIPRRTDSVYHSSLGDCKDTALLLAAFYNYCGFDSRLALLRTNNSGLNDSEFPFLGAFNHAICYVDYKGGLFLDGTVDRAGIYELPDSDRGVEAFIVSDKGHIIKKIDPDLYNKNNDKVINRVKILPNGDAEFSRMLCKTGSIALSSRESFDVEKKKRNEIEEFWRNEYAGSVIKSFSVLEKSPGKPIQYSYTGFLREFAGKSSSCITIPSVMQKDYFLKSLRKYSSRENDLYFSSDYSSEVVYEYEIPEGYSFAGIPESFESISKCISLSFSAVKTASNKVTVSVKTSINKGIVAKEEYAELRSMLLKFSIREDSFVVVEKK
ncbi:MAG: DUF3857 and transglutaminase domain-containing protein [Spirochaetes bacterium]|nr:DUF3857 and transglutaminase domain-containing protein [Spirochaetota bacterium]